MHDIKKLTFIKRFLISKSFIDSDFTTKVTVGFMNLFSPLLLFFVSLLIYQAYLHDLKDLFLLEIDTLFIFCIGLSYFYFIISGNLSRYVKSCSFLLCIYMPFEFYGGGVAGGGVLWLFLVPMLLFILNDLKSGIIFNSIFLGSILITSLVFNEDLLLVYNHHFLIRFYVAFIIYIGFVICLQFVRFQMYNSNELHKSELEAKNIELNTALDLQKEILQQLLTTEEEEKTTARNLKSMINNTDDLIWLVDNNGGIQLFNDAFGELVKTKFGIDPIGKDIFKQLAKQKENSFNVFWRERYQAVLLTGKRKSYFDQEIDEKGLIKYVITDFYPILKDEKTVGISCFSRDVTAQRTAKKEKEELARINTTIIASLGEIVYDFDVINDEFTWNDAIYQVLGYNYAQMGTTFKDFLSKVHTEEADSLVEEIEDLKETGFNTPIDIRVLTKQEGYIWMQNRVNVLYDDEGVPSRLIGVLFNIEERKKVEVNQLRAVVKGVDLERKRIAGEIHDGLGQTLIAANLILSSLEDCESDQAQKQNQERLSTVGGLINDAIDEGREISHSIMPKSLEDYGLISSMKSLLNKIKLSREINVDFNCNVTDERRFPIEIENNLYRVTQEALNNIIKHSSAKEVVIQLVAHESSIILTIEDDGVGFVKLVGEPSLGLGLQNIKNRISSIGGSLQLDTHAGYGTLVTIEVEIK